MNKGDTCRIVVDEAREAADADLLDGLSLVHEGEGWAVQERLVVPVGESVENVKVELALTRPSHSYLHGDVPFPTTWTIPDGHVELGPRECEADYKYVNDWGGCVGRTYLERQSVSGRTVPELYRGYLQKCIDWPRRAASYGVAVGDLDYWEGNPGLEPDISAMEVTVPQAVYEVRHGGGGLFVDEPNVDRNLEVLGRGNKEAHERRLMLMAWTGGYLRPDESGMLIVGGPREWDAEDPAVALFGGFGSMLNHIRVPNSFFTHCLTGSHTVAAFYNVYAQLRAWRMLTDGWTAGEVGRELAHMLLTNILGNPMMRLPFGVLFPAQAIQAIAADDVLSKRFKVGLAALAVSAPPIADAPPRVDPVPPQSPPKAAVKTARYRQSADHADYKDVKAQVQRAWDSGAELYVYSDSRPCLRDPSWPEPGRSDQRDFRYGKLKEAYVETEDGRKATYGQLDLIDPAKLA